ncbi:MAG: DUF4240 domain-containing protein [Candidatus Obscuribacterales bacterium]|nr:DUF4240 domain-containing protein [Candidatus Obscuribacterales bacterium]
MKELNENAFWTIIEKCKPKSSALQFSDDHYTAYDDSLSRMSDEDLIAFARTRERMKQKAYNYKLWYAACAVNRVCSDDSFEVFRAALIMLGRSIFERCIETPDEELSKLNNAGILATVERFDYVAVRNYKSRHDSSPSLYELLADLGKNEPTGTEQEFQSESEYWEFLRAKYPLICKRYCR